MSSSRVNPPVIKALEGTALAQDADATGEWIDVSAWTDKRVSVQVDGANTDYDLEMHISPKHYYELNNMAATTEDYEVVSLLEANNVQTLTSIDAEDVDELQRPFRSVRFVLGNDSATALTEYEVFIEGWS